MAVVVGEAAVKVRPEIDDFEDEASGGILDALGSIGAKGAAVLGSALAAGGMLMSGVTSAIENAALGDKLAAQLGASGDYAADLGAIAGDLYANAYGENLGEVNDALRSVIQSGAVMEDASNEQLQSVTASAMDLATAFDQDVAATAQAAGRMVQTGLADTAEEALDILTRGFQQGADAGGDLLDVVSEYGTTFSDLGLDGAASVGLLNQALAAGIPNADFAADALREMGIIAAEGSEEAAAALESLGLNAQDYFDAMAQGGPAASTALDTVLDSLRNTEDAGTRSAAATALIGGQYEDLGDALLSLDPSAAVDSLGQVEGAAGNMGQTLNDNAQTNITAFTRGLQGAFTDVLGNKVLPLVDTVASTLATSFGPALDAAGGVMRDVVAPALQSVGGFIAEWQTPLTIIAGLLTALFVPAMVTAAATSVTSAATTAAAWVTTQAGAIASAASQGIAFFGMIAGWVAAAASAVLNGAIIVGQWILMGAQAMLGAARMAAAWLIALGPIGLLIAAVVGVVALVIANWDTIVQWTTTAFQAVGDAIVAAWEWIKGAFSAALQFVIDLFMNWTLIGLIITHWDTIKSTFSAGVDAAIGFVTGLPGRAVDALSSLGSSIAGVASTAWQWFYDNVVSKVGEVISFVGGLPGKVVSAVGNLGSLLVQKGKDLIQGLVDGIASAAGFVGDVARNVVNSVIRFINSQVIDRINNLLEFSIMGVTVNPPDIPRIPTLHEGGVFDSGRGEGLALLRDDELVATPEQRRVADNLLRGLLDGRLPTAPAPGQQPVTEVTINEHVYAAPGESAASIAARTTQGVVWNLNNGITRRVGAGAGALA